MFTTNLELFAEKYGITKQAFREFLRTHLAEINDDGVQHCYKDGRSWTFDEYAIERINILRNYDNAAIEKIENDRVAALKNEIFELRQQLQDANQKVTEMATRSEENARLFALSQKELRELEASRNEEKTELARLRERAAAQTELDAERDRRQASEIENIKQQNAAEIELLKQKNENILVKFRNELQNKQQKNEDMSFEVSKLRHELIQERRSLWEKICSIFD